MKKKLLTVVLSLVLCFGMGTTAMAATSPNGNNSSNSGSAINSPSGNNSSNAGSSGTNSPSGNNSSNAGSSNNGSSNNGSSNNGSSNNGNSSFSQSQTAITQGDLNDVQRQILGTYFTAMQDIDNDTSLTAAQKVAKKAAYVQKMINGVLGLNYTYKAGVYGTYELKASDLSKPIAISVPGITAADGAVVAHLKDDGTWENVPVTGVGDGVVYAQFTSLSPVFVAAVEGTAATGTTVAPKTADAGMGMVFVLVAAASATGAVVCAKRKLS